MKKKIKSEESIISAVKEFYYENDNISFKDQKKIEGFFKTYTSEQFSTLNNKQIAVLYHMFWEQSQNSDFLSFSLGVGRRSAVNTANALCRRGFVYWDYPIGSNIDDGYDITINRDAMITDKYMNSDWYLE